MDKRAVMAAALLPTLLAATQVQAANVREVIDRGEDGPARYRVVYCDNDTRASMVEYLEPRRVCVQAQHLEQEVCREDWTVENAAAYVCAGSPGPSLRP